jgi:predicted phage-related endonuclease
MENKFPGYCKTNRLRLPKEPDNIAIRLGKNFEFAIIMMAERLEGKKIIARQKFYKHKTHKFLTVHPDGTFQGSQSLFEGKTANIFTYNNDWGPPETDRVPIDIAVQCQHQLLVTGKKQVILYLLVFPKQQNDFEEIEHKLDPFKIQAWAETLAEMGFLKRYIIGENKKSQNNMIKKYKAFWKNHVQKKILPPPKPGNIDDMLVYFKWPPGKIAISKIMEGWHNEWVNINPEINRLQKRKEQIKAFCLEYAKKKGIDVKDENDKSLIFVSRSGNNLFSWNGKTFRASGGSNE